MEQSLVHSMDLITFRCHCFSIILLLYQKCLCIIYVLRTLLGTFKDREEKLLFPGVYNQIYMRDLGSMKRVMKPLKEFNSNSENGLNTETRLYESTQQYTETSVTWSRKRITWEISYRTLLPSLPSSLCSFLLLVKL